MKKEFLVISEKHERITVRWKTKRYRPKAKCKRCGERVNWLSLEETSAITGMDFEEIRFEIEKKNFDVLNNTNSQILICPNSILGSEKIKYK